MSDDVTKEHDSKAVTEAARHLQIGELVDTFYTKLSATQRVMLKSYLPKELTALLDRK